MKSDEKDVPVSNDYAKSNEPKGMQLPDFLTQKTGALIGIGVVVVICAVIWGMGHIDFSRPEANALDSRPGFAALRQRVASLAEVDGLCAKDDRTTCLCELADRLRDDHRAIEALLASDPSLKAFQIKVRQAGAAAAVSYDLAKLPRAPAEGVCLNAVSAPTIIDDDGTTAAAQSPAPPDATPLSVPAESEPAEGL